jgi:hypothetical protein
MSITLGCDPELFLFDNLEQRIVPAVGKVGGTKWKPKKVDGGTVQLDGTLVEFGVDPDGDIQPVINDIRRRLDNRYHGRYELRCGSTARYSAEDIDFNSSAFDVGCSPQFRFENGTLTAVPQAPSEDGVVHAGGHIHIGFPNIPKEHQDINSPVLVQSVNMFSRMLIPLSGGTLSGVERRRCLMMFHPTIRVKPYGFEWRNPSSIWLADKTIYSDMRTLMNSIYADLCAGRNGMSRETSLIDERVWQKFALLKGIASRLPTKYQGTLPLDY